MAGDWIPMRLDLAEDPAVMAIADATGLTTFAVVGCLHRLWSWANAQSRDGHASGVTPARLDALVGVTGFAPAMAEAGWLEVSGGGVTFTNFDRWNTQPAKRRILATQRKRLERSRSGCDKSATREEKRRVENTEEKTPPTPRRNKPVADPTLFDRFWRAYPRKVAKPDAHKAFVKLKPTEEFLAALLAALAWQRESHDWTKDGGHYIPYPASWLNARRWEDERPAGGARNGTPQRPGGGVGRVGRAEPGQGEYDAFRPGAPAPAREVGGPPAAEDRPA